MNTPESITQSNKDNLNIFQRNWNELDPSQKLILVKIWKVLTYKWQLQILFNLPFLIWWALDSSVARIHEFDLKLISYLNLPEWILSLIGFGHTIN